ncbi:MULTISPECIES: metal-sensitive transcriptional regulator [unclassified Sphingomonas]|jgi:DNA-binding FrmR family transcriptional regulator|uniref:metal-sensitive transcriptional regulator n=1 Tax=unclassified Sphingomonas TaxID=196159 RepID=UPI0008358786|nr:MULTISPECIES: metal-sensitive transcriptional regulator [unclassified Sphingomonas]MCH4893532.1 metal-sensing transcriptional repressor [Sphingomonas sp. SFZ2018-12]
MGRHKAEIRNRLKRIEGQVRGVIQMVEDDRYCIDILHQVQAIKAALGKAESEILKDHAACCVGEAIAAGDANEQRAKFNELIELFEKVKR